MSDMTAAAEAVRTASADLTELQGSSITFDEVTVAYRGKT